MESESVWRALSSPHRRKLLDLLKEGPKTTGELARSLEDLSRFAVMQHLGVLEGSGLVLFRREGKRRFNYANPVPIRELYERWVNPLGSRAAEAALHLKQYAEQQKEVAQAMDHEQFRLEKVELEITLNAPREKVFKALTEDYDKWWPHRYKPDSTVYYEAKPGGLIGERFKDGGGAVTGYVAYIDPPSKIIGNGPSSMGRGVSFYAVETLEEVDGKTVYRKSIQMWGVVPEEMVTMFREGARMLMEVALRGYVEEGREYSPEDTK